MRSIPRGAFVWLAFGFWALARVMADPVIQAEILGANLKLTVSGDPSATYVLESSTDLKTWALLDGTTLAGSSASSSVDLGDSARFYRARALQNGNPELPTVKVTLSTNDVASTVVTPDSGGECRFIAASGIAFILTFATNSVADPTVIRMTQIEGIDGVAAAQGFLAGVMIEPTDLTLIEPASLTISFTNSYAPLDLAGYGFGVNGEDWHLNTSFAETNFLEISLPALGGVGCGIFTAAEMQALPEPSVPTNFPTARNVALQSLPENCYPDEHTRARKIDQFLRNGLDVFSEHTAKQLHLQRRGQNLNPKAPLTGKALALATADYASFYAYHIVPFLGAGETSCVIGTELLSWSRLLAMHARRLGVTDLPWATPPDGFVCKVVKRCKEQARDCCQAGTLPKGQLAREFASADALASSFGLSGANCGGPKLSDVTSDCSPQWYGHLSVHESHRVISANHSGTLKGADTLESELSIEADVATSNETLTPIFGLVELTLIGGAAGTYNHSGWSWEFLACNCQPSPGNVPIGRHLAPLDGCPGSRVGTTSISGTTNAAVTYKLNIWLPVTNSIPGITPLDADTIANFNRSSIRGLDATLPVGYNGSITSRATCEDGSPRPPITPVHDRTFLGQQRSSTIPDEQLFTSTQIRWSESKNDHQESHDDSSDNVDTTDYTFKLTLQRRPN